MCDKFLYQMPSDNSLTTNKHASYNAPKCLPAARANHSVNNNATKKKDDK